MAVTVSGDGTAGRYSSQISVNREGVSMFSFIVQQDLTQDNVIIMWLFRLQECRGWFCWNHGLGVV